MFGSELPIIENIWMLSIEEGDMKGKTMEIFGWLFIGLIVILAYCVCLFFAGMDGLCPTTNPGLRAFFDLVLLPLTIAYWVASVFSK